MCIQWAAAISGSSAEALAVATAARWEAAMKAMSLLSADTYARADATTMSSFAPLPEKVRCVDPPCDGSADTT